MSYVEATDTSLRKTGQIKLHGPNGFAGMRKAGALVAKCLDDLTDVVKPGVPTSRIDDFVRDFAFGHGGAPCQLGFMDLDAGTSFAFLTNGYPMAGYDYTPAGRNRIAWPTRAPAS